MLYLTSNIFGSFSPTANNSYSLTGHMWYQLTDDNGNMNSYGYGPQGKPTADGPGAVNRIDSSYYNDRSYTRAVWISQVKWTRRSGQKKWANLSWQLTVHAA